MRCKSIFYVVLMLLTVFFLGRCDQFSDLNMKGPGPDSDSPPWAQGNTDENPHINQNENAGTPRGGDYGDLYVLRRDENGVPEMRGIDVDGDGQIGELEYFVQPIDINGNLLELNAEGDLVDPTQAIEVDFGRLNIVRSPESVLDDALEEALKVLDAPGAVITLDFCGRLTSTYPDPLTGETIVKTIDSPRENMAIYRTIMRDLTDPRLGFMNGFDPLQVAASCFAAGSDKTGTVDIDEVVYINGFMDCCGLNPILNEHEYDFNNDYKYYFNFGDCTDPVDCNYTQNRFQYNRDVYKTRYLKIITLNGDGTYNEEIMSVWQAMELTGKFTHAWPFGVTHLTHVEGFAWAVDDAVQVLDYVHGDSNISFLPDYNP